MKKLLVFLVMALIVSAVHALTLPLTPCFLRHAPEHGLAHQPHSQDEASASSPAANHAPQHNGNPGHACCTGLCPHSEPRLFQPLAPTRSLAPHPLLHADLGLSSAIFKPPKAHV